MPVVKAKSYVEYRNSGYWIAGTRVSLDSIVYLFRNGMSPESIVQSFPLLTLEQVYGAVTFYLANSAEIDAYLNGEEEEFDAMPQPLQATDPSLYNRLISAKPRNRGQGVNICYQADADLNQMIVTGVLRPEPTINFQTASDGGLQGLNDLEVLAISAQQGRILVTHDRKTMPSQFAEFIMRCQSAGVLVVSKKLAIKVVVEELVLIWSVSTAEEWINRIAKIPL